MIEKQEEGSNTWEKVPGLITDTNHTVKGLKEGKTYKFRVKAENLYGVSEPLEGNRVTAKNPFGQWIAQPAFFHLLKIYFFTSLAWQGFEGDELAEGVHYLLGAKGIGSHSWFKAKECCPGCLAAGDRIMSVKFMKC